MRTNGTTILLLVICYLWHHVQPVAGVNENCRLRARRLCGEGEYDERLPPARDRSGEDSPMFNSTEDGPYNVSVTEGESVTFNCQPFSVLEVAIIWLQNYEPIIDTDNPPTRFVLSNDNRSLTIRDVCRDCLDRENKTDLTLIQCNASNIHGYTLAQGYINVLMKTKVTIRGPKNVSVDFLEEKQVVFQCSVTADPSTRATVRWYKTEPFGDLVRTEPPYVNVANEFLIITIDPNCSIECVKYLGEYRCVGDNKYSKESRTITLSYLNRPPPAGDKEETWAAWKILIVALAIGLEVFLVGIFLRSYLKLKHNYNDVKRQVKNRKLSNSVGIYEDAGYDSVGFPLERLAGHKEGSATNAINMYDHIGYDSIDQVQKQRALREETMHPSSRVREYESIDESVKEAMACRPSPQLPDEGITRDDRMCPISLRDATSGGYTGQICRSESFTNEAENSPTSNRQSEALNTCSATNLEEVNFISNLRKPESNPKDDNSCLDLTTTKEHLELVSTEVNTCLERVSTTMDPYLDLVSTEGNSYLDMVSTEEKSCVEENQYLDLEPYPKD